MKNLQLNPPEPRYTIIRSMWWWNVVNDEGKPVDHHYFSKQKAQHQADLYNAQINLGFTLGKSAMFEAIRKQKIANNLSQQ